MSRNTLPAVALLTLLSASPALAEPFVVNCAPGQRAVVQNEPVRGEHVTRVTCAGSSYRPAWSHPRYDVRRRTAANRALVIGGSAAAGAGIGGIVRGGKGALIGAALGGGAASLVEGLRR
jgi:hypothetical protein